MFCNEHCGLESNELNDITWQKYKHFFGFVSDTNRTNASKTPRKIK